MNGSSYRDQDFAFGKLMLTLRTATGLTQTGLAEALRVSRRSVADWEAGTKYPKAENLKQFIALAVELQAFHPDHEAEEIRSLWRAAHQKVLLDERWLTSLLKPPPEKSAIIPTNPTPKRPRFDWNNAIAVGSFYGREWELSQLTTWIAEDRCRVVGILGMGGIGKSALSVSLMRQVADQFDVVIWRSLRDSPTCESLLGDFLETLMVDQPPLMPINFEQQLNLLLGQLRSKRALIVLDNLETLLEEGKTSGHMRRGYADYERFLRRVAESEHQSCLLLTSREKPVLLAPLEGINLPVRMLRIIQLETKHCEQIIAEKGAVGTDSERAWLIDRYAGNPLALKIVTQTIVDLFDGSIAPFQDQGEIIFGGIRNLLEEQFTRLSALEQTVLLWLAIMREPTTLDELFQLSVKSMARAQLLEAVQALHRRSLIERGQKPGSFTLQSVVLEYATAHLIEVIGNEIQQGEWHYLVDYGLELGQVREFVRQTQVRLIVSPILGGLEDQFPGKSAVLDHLTGALDWLRNQVDMVQGYAPANLLALIQALRGNLRGVDLSHLSFRGAYLQGVSMQDATLAGAALQACVFTETFDAIYDVAASSNGEFWAASSQIGEIRLWRAGGQTLLRMWQAHTDMVWTLTFSPDSLTLATGSWDGTVKLWDVATAEMQWSGRHNGLVNSVVYSRDGSMIASSGNDAVIRLWARHTGAELQTLRQPAAIPVVLWSPAGNLLASADTEGIIRLWEFRAHLPAVCVQTLQGHSRPVTGLAFSPDGSRLASAGWDGKVKVWDVHTGQLQVILEGHSEIVYRVAWSPDGRTLASSSRDKTIRLWDVQQGEYRAVLRGHHAGIRGLVFIPGSLLLTGSEDGTLRMWDVASGVCLRIWQGYAASLRDVDWSPAGDSLVSAGTDSSVTLYDISGVNPDRVFDGHTGVAFGVRWSPDGQMLASSELNNAIYLWDAKSGECLHILAYPGDVGNFFDGLAWSPDGQMLASGTYRSGLVVWNISTRSQQWHQNAISIRNVAWSPDGSRLVGGGDDGNVYILDAADGHLIMQLAGHNRRVTAVAWSPDGTRLASSGSDQKHSELIVWDAESGSRICTIAEHSGTIDTVAWGVDENTVITGDSSGSLCWWDVQTTKRLWLRAAHQGTVQSLRRHSDASKLASCGDDGAIKIWDLGSGVYLQTLRRDRPYERLNITGIRGLTEAQKTTLRTLGAIEDSPSPKSS